MNYPDAIAWCEQGIRGINQYSEPYKNKNNKEEQKDEDENVSLFHTKLNIFSNL